MVFFLDDPESIVFTEIELDMMKIEDEEFHTFILDQITEDDEIEV